MAGESRGSAEGDGDRGVRDARDSRGDWDSRDVESTSGFAVPEGLRPPSPPADEHPTSEFAVPEGLSLAPPEAPPRSDFTPPQGIPQFARGAPWHDRMRAMVRLPLSERPAPAAREARGEGEEASPPVPRVLDLTLRIGELLLAGGEGAEDVEAAMFGVTHAYGLDRCEVTVTFTLLSVTHQPSLVDPSVSLSRTVRRRGTDYTRLAAVFRLVDDICSESEQVTLEEAYGRLATIRRNRHPYSKWQLTFASGLLAGSASVLVGGDWWVFLLAALGAMVGDRLAWLAASRALPEFYQFVAFAMAPAAVGIGWAVAHPTHSGEVEAAAMITGGLFALIPGRALVAAVHDGLTGYYLTASARLLEVVYLSVGIICGVLAVLYMGETSGVTLDPDVLLEAVTRPATQLAAALLLSLTFCVLLQQEKGTLIPATLNGGVAWVVFGAMHDTAGLSPFAATAVAAGMVGLFGQLLSRYRFTSSLPYVTAAIGPLLPGSAVYLGLLGFAQGNVDTGLDFLLRAVTLALAIAIGVNLGGELARLFISTPGQFTPIGRRGAKRTRGF
ncbi:threonine/serine ThrE exporter family protein [Streptomyces sp. 6N223]|uniref:threonine/serine ThrE exporter family protein n=1 Tax=Streptomyces sp. 6N223 TaxID=3457412 RepID=UPI003FD350F5